MPKGHVDSVVFFGTPTVAARVLEGLLDARMKIELVVTGADARRGRGNATSPTPVREVAERHSIPVTFEAEDALALGTSESRLGVVVAYGSIIREPLLSALPMVNIHFSQLPRWRGAAPVERAILEGDKTIGVDLMRVAKGLDEGDIFDEVIIPIEPEHTVETLRNELADIAVNRLVIGLKEGFGTPRPQEGDAVYARKIHKDELRIDWERAAEQIRNVTRIGGGTTSFRGVPVKVREVEVVPGAGQPGEVVDAEQVTVATGQGSLRVVTIQPSGKRPMAAADWARGVRLRVGDMFGD